MNRERGRTPCVAKLSLSASARSASRSAKGARKPQHRASTAPKRACRTSLLCAPTTSLPVWIVRPPLLGGVFGEPTRTPRPGLRGSLLEARQACGSNNGCIRKSQEQALAYFRAARSSATHAVEDEDVIHGAVSPAFAAIGLAPETPFPAIEGARRFVCTACGSRCANVSPDWRGHRAAGMGRCHFGEIQACRHQALYTGRQS